MRHFNGHDGSEGRALIAELLGKGRAEQYLSGLDAAGLGDLFEQGIALLLRHGRFEHWWQALVEFEPVQHRSLCLHQARPEVTSATPPSGVEDLVVALRPWKKGPLLLYQTEIDAEWRSDWKWNRLEAIATSLEGRRVLDVGTGNGYFLLRALGAGASFVLGLEPNALSAFQYLAIARGFGELPMALLPLPAEHCQSVCKEFDTVLSMGVLYHRRSPLDHLSLLKGFLRPGGELILETLVVEGEEGYSLLPVDRYAGMRNVWFVPTSATLVSWLVRMGFEKVQVGPTVTTTEQEQRCTERSGPVSLKDFLHPGLPERTIEGHPAPRRVIVVAHKPS